jgi:nitrite reductase/ring-hydroxylating ferredoxin subunit/uncharacterized membrane protein
MKEILQGRPFGHPLHSLLVHFPVGLLVFSLLLDLLTLLWMPSSAFYRGAFYTLAAGAGLGLLAGVAGFADWVDIRRDHPSRPRATTHMILNLTVIGLALLSLVLRANRLEQTAVSLVPLLLSLLGVGILLFSGYLGGTLVFDDGIGAGRHRRRRPLPDDTLRISASPDSQGWVVLADASALEGGRTLRADVHGNVMAVVQRGEKVYAFQEFCTHRYGPLSEGALYDEQVECPWHRSCFDIRTGKVTEGPAKVDLKTFPAELREGKIRVQVKT